MPSKDWKTQNQPQSKSQPQSAEIPQSQTALKQPVSSEAQLDALINHANQVIAGLQAGENHNAAAIALTEAESFRLSAEKLAEVVKFYRNPDARVAMAYLIAGEDIAAQQGKKFQPQVLAVTVPPLELPALPSFSRFYSGSDSSQPRLTDGSSFNEQNGQSPASEDTPIAS